MYLALGLFVAGGFFLSSFDAVGKLLMTDTNLLVILWARYLGQFAFSIGIALWKIGPLFVKTDHLQIQMLRSFLLLVTSFLFFGGLQFLPLAETSAIAFTTPLWVAVLSGPLVGERVQRSDWWVAAIGFSGILFIVRPGTEIFHYGAALVAIMAVLNAVYQLLTRRLTQDSPFTTFFYSGLLGTLILSAWFVYAGIPELPNLSTLFLLCSVGVLAGLGHLLFVLAFYRASPASLTPFVYLQMIWAIGFGWLIFRQLPDGPALLGMLIIIGSGLWLILHRHRQPRAAR